MNTSIRFIGIFFIVTIGNIVSAEKYSDYELLYTATSCGQVVLECKSDRPVTEVDVWWVYVDGESLNVFTTIYIHTAKDRITISTIPNHLDINTDIAVLVDTRAIKLRSPPFKDGSMYGCVTFVPDTNADEIDSSTMYKIYTSKSSFDLACQSSTDCIDTADVITRMDDKRIFRLPKEL